MSIFKKFDHIGVVVENLKKAMDELQFFFGLECLEMMEIEEAGIRTAFYPLGSGQMELIEFQKPPDAKGVKTRDRVSPQRDSWSGGLFLFNRGIGFADRNL